MPVTKITLSTAMRARDVSRPREDQLAEAAEREEAAGRHADEPAPGRAPRHQAPRDQATRDHAPPGLATRASGLWDQASPAPAPRRRAPAAPQPSPGEQAPAAPAPTGRRRRRRRS